LSPPAVKTPGNPAARAATAREQGGHVPWPERSLLRSVTTRFAQRWLGAVEGVQHLHGHKGFVLAVNHSSFLDFFVLATLFDRKLRRRLRFWAKRPMMRHRLLGPFCRAAGCLEVVPGSDHRRLFRESVDWLANAGDPLCVFPEGARTRDGQPLRFRLGYLRLAHAAQVPVIPVHLANAFEVWPPSRTLPRSGKVDVHIHPPRAVRASDSATLVRINAEVRELCTGVQAES